MKKKLFVGLARVHGKAHRAKGLSKDSQEVVLRSYAAHHNGKIVKMFRLKKTASEESRRATYSRLLTYVKQNAPRLAGTLFYQYVTRNLGDFMQLSDGHAECGVQILTVTETAKEWLELDSERAAAALETVCS